ncbi:MAG: transposase [Roseovarius sp.]
MPDLRELGITGPAPARLVEGGPPTEASIFVCKNADHPLSYRQSQILPRWGIEIHRFTLADWVGVASLHPGPVVDRLSEHLQASTCSWMKQRHLCPIPATNHSKSRIDDPAPMERPAVKLKTKRS